MNLRLSNISHGGTGSLGNYRGLVIHVANPFCGLRRTCAPRAVERRGGSGPVPAPNSTHRSGPVRAERAQSSGLG